MNIDLLIGAAPNTDLYNQTALECKLSARQQGRTGSISRLSPEVREQVLAEAALL